MVMYAPTQKKSGPQFAYMRIWTEETYGLKIDERLDSYIEVPGLFPWDSVVIEEEWQPAANRTDGWFYGAWTVAKWEKYRIEANRSLKFPMISIKDQKIFIPRIVPFLEALVDQINHIAQGKPRLTILAEWQIRNLVPYLYLERPHQRDSLLFQVNSTTDEYLETFIKRYKRKPRCFVTRHNEDGTPSSEMQVFVVKEWDPTTYPNHKCNYTKDQ